MSHRLRLAILGVLLVSICPALAEPRPALPAAATLPATMPAATRPALAPADAIIVPEGWFPASQVKKPPLPAKVTKAFVIPIRETITKDTAKAVAEKIDRCKAGGAEMVIFDIDTPGGEGAAMNDIMRLIRADLSKIRTVAFVNPEAISAGALIAISCDEIVMTPRGVIGDARPVVVDSGGLKPLSREDRSKIESFIRGEIRNAVGDTGHDETLCEAMVTSAEAWLIRNSRTQELKVISAAKWPFKVHGAPGSTTRPGTDSAVDSDSPWAYVRTFNEFDTAVTLTAREAKDIAFCSAVVDDMKGLAKHYNIAVGPTVLADKKSEKEPATMPAATRPALAPADAIIVPEGWFPRPEVKKPALPEKVTNAFVIPLREEVTKKLADTIKRKVTRCKTAGADLVIFDIDTPGGSGGAMLEIVRTIMENLPRTRTVAFVNPEAISAGSIISLACDDIVMNRRGVIGDAMPIMPGPSGGFTPIPKEERGKIESYIRGEIRTIAQSKGHNEALCEALVTLTLEVWLIRDVRTLELQVVDAAKWRGKVRNDPGATTQPSLLASGSDSRWEYVRTVDGPDTLVTLTANEASALAFTTATVEDMTELEKLYHVTAPPKVLEDTWSEALVEFLTSAPVRALLSFILIFCIYAEFQSPGLGLAAVAGLVAAAILFGSHLLIGMAQWWEIAAFFVGLIMIVVEVFIFPTVGILAIIGGILCFVSLVAIGIGAAPNTVPIPSTTLEWSNFTESLMALTAAIVASIIAAFFISKHLQRIPLARRLVLAPVVVPPDVSVSDKDPVRIVKPGEVGTVVKMCRPVGKVLFGEALLDATSEGMVIEAGSKVRVLRREGNHVIVEKVENS